MITSSLPSGEKAHQKNKRSGSTLLAKLVRFFPDQGSLQALPGDGRIPSVIRWRNSSQCMKGGKCAQKGPTK